MKKNKYRAVLPIALLLTMLFSTCDNRSDRNASKNNYQVELVRFEQELFSIDIYSLTDSALQFVYKYPEFTALFTSRIIEVGDTAAPLFGQKLSKFVTDQNIYSFNKRVNEVFPDFESQIDIISRGLENYQKQFPENEIPTIYTYVSGLNQSIVVAENILGISLDKYLGKDEILYNSVYPPIPDYLRRTMQPEYIASDAIRAWVVTDIDFIPERDNFLAKVLNEARAVYITKQLLPELSDSLLWGFTQKELNFCSRNESEMWKYLIEKKLLFSTDNFRISKFVDPGPFTKEFTRESPARAAVWIGYRIIDKYMSRSKKMTLSELAASNDFQFILNESRYNP